MKFFRKLPCWGAAVAVWALLCIGPIQAQTPVQTPASLIQVYADALKNNALFRARLAQFEATNQLGLQVEGQLYPQLGVSAGYDYIREEITGDFFGLDSIDSEGEFDRQLLTVALTQALYRPDLVIASNQADLARTQSRFELDGEEDELLLDVAESYFGVLAAQDLEGLARAEQNALVRQLDQARTRYAAGLLTEADLSDARAQLSLSEARVLQARSALVTAQSALELIAGTPYKLLKVLPEGMVLARPSPPDIQQWVERARAQNLAVLSARLSVQIAELEVQKARKLRWPKVNLAATAYRLDSGGGATGDRQETEGRIGVKVDMPLYAGGSIDAKVAETQAKYQAALAQLDAAVGVAVRDAQVAFLEITSGIREVPARYDAVVAGRQSESATGGGFEAGTRTTADVLRAIRARYEAERDYSAARYEFVMDSLRLKAAAGNLANADLSRFDRLLRSPPEPAQP